MTTVTLTMTTARWGRILRELDVPHLGWAIRRACRAMGRDTIEPGDGPIAMLKTGAKLYWSDSTGQASISGYASDGSDVDPYVLR